MEDNRRAKRPGAPERRAGPPRYRTRWLWPILFLFGAFLVFNFIFQWVPMPWGPKPPEPPPAPKVVVEPPPAPPVIDYRKIKEESDPVLGELIQGRKEEFGLEKSVDMVVSTDETIRVGDMTVSFAEILAAIRAETGRDDDEPADEPTGKPPAGVAEQDLTTVGDAPAAGPPNAAAPKPSKPVQYYGVHVVRTGDTLWDVHFAILREYLAFRGVSVPPNADQVKLSDGSAPGVARILKWAETMVYIYNVKTRRLDKNLDQLSPEQKIVVLNLSKLDNRLKKLKPDELDQVRFIGGVLYLEGPPEPKPNP